MWCLPSTFMSNLRNNLESLVKGSYFYRWRKTSMLGDMMRVAQGQTRRQGAVHLGLSSQLSSPQLWLHTSAIRMADKIDILPYHGPTLCFDCRDWGFQGSGCHASKVVELVLKSTSCETWTHWMVSAPSLSSLQLLLGLDNTLWVIMHN